MKKKLSFLILVLLLICQNNIFINAQIPINGLVACYPFTENANDGSGNAYHGTVFGSTLTTDRFNRSNSAYYFDGNSDYISLPFAPFNLQSFSYSVWAYVTSYPSPSDQGMVISIGSYGGGNSIALCNSYSTGVTGWSCNVYYPGGQHYWIAGSLPLLNTWYHIVMTRDENYLKCYLNGQLVSSQPTYNTVPYYGSGTNMALIGKRCQTTLNQFFNGKIDDIHIYNRALTATEVNNLYIGDSNAVTITANPGTTINQGENVTFTAIVNSYITNPTYQWLVNNNIVGENSSSYSATNLNNGDVVKCLVFPSQACEVPVYSNSLTIIIQNVNIMELNKLNGITIFPNPGTGKFTFSFNSNNESIYKIEITNVMGKQVFTESISGFSGVYTKQIDLTKICKGLYTISLLNKDTKITKKFVID